MSFSKVLIANRGEISIRIIRACRELGIKTVAVHSEADESSMHRRLADESYLLGPAPAAESYLNVERIIEVIRESGAEAVHPGYGFLSESAAFARSVEEPGAIWIGPPPETMELVGDKVRAKELAGRAEVPVIPGYSGGDQDEERLSEEARRIGYPVLVKANAGGGGRGMRSVNRPEDFEEAVRGAKREAESSFGDGSVFLEKLVENPRHVEVQVMGDHHGNVIHLYERDCSIQRRHQKVVEEAPSPALDAELREAICDAAVRLAAEAGYRNAGTVEFLLDGEDFYFLEMNARLQVEHPVTELVTGLDLVHLQLAVAAGEPLPDQQDVTLRGSAIEVRIYAEDPETSLPAGGKLHSFAPPEGPGIRNDVGVETGDEVSLNYDSMISKLIVFASDRETTVQRLRQGLRDYTVLGVPTNLPLLRRIAENPAFAAGETTTGFLEKHDISGKQEQDRVPEKAILLAAVGESLPSRGKSWEPFSSGSWRPMGIVRFRYNAGGETHLVETSRISDGRMRVRMNGRDSVVEQIFIENGFLRATLDDEPVSCGFAVDSSSVFVSDERATYRLERSLPPSVDEAVSGGSDPGRTSLTSPMPGTVVSVLVEEGEEVEEGQVLLVLEAMKMEQQVTAPYAGTVRALPYGERDLVPGGAVLAEIEEA
ncbi:acetyl-CoA carboxylase biotin carboxylase subunit [soil metagenome]